MVGYHGTEDSIMVINNENDSNDTVMIQAFDLFIPYLILSKTACIKSYHSCQKSKVTISLTHER